MKSNTIYQAPVLQELDIYSEGVLCGSNEAGAGSLDDNTWAIDFDDNI